ncbi:unnamed protein product [Paramecium primaurelia]|uniref:Alpha-carbonic anhydrase domain-containing protein n=1 Tax=Paramecium primaurelia TaxID=5886 RepID=A0A8S1QDR1_PARPR|nr:unnamed protein product [Paramecium primaurelia]
MNILVLIYFGMSYANTPVKEYGQCLDETLAQSPIQLKPPFGHIELKLEFEFLEARDLQIKHTGYELVCQGAFGFVKHNNKIFNAYQVKFKSPSEHSLSENDYFYPIEMQIFLISQQKFRIGFSVFFRLNKDHTENALLAKFGFGKNIIKELQPGDFYVVPEAIDLGVLFDDTDKFLVYQGSDTFPPCGQMVWLTLFKIYDMSSNQAIDFPELLLYSVREQKEMKRPIYANFDPALFIITDGEMNTKQDLKTQRTRNQVDKKLVKDNFYIYGAGEGLELDGFVFTASGQSGGKIVRTEDFFIIKLKPEAKDVQEDVKEIDQQQIDSQSQQEQTENNNIEQPIDVQENSIPEDFEETDYESKDETKEPQELSGQDNSKEGGDSDRKSKLDLHSRIKERQASKSKDQINQYNENKVKEKQEQQIQDEEVEGDIIQEIDQQKNWPRLCQTGKSQSPIILDLRNLLKQPIKEPILSYYVVPKELYLSNDGYQLKLISDPGGFGAMSWNGKIYQALELNFHTPSEHTIGENQFRMNCEIQIMHKSIDGDILYLVLFLHNTYPNESNEFLEQIGLPSSKSINYRAVEKGELIQINKDIKLADLVRDVSEFVYYTGSLTVPPCVENIQYVIRRSRLPISLTQIENMQRLIGKKENFRPIQNLNGRNLYTN